MRKMVHHGVKTGMGFVMFAIVAVAVVGFVVLSLWNALMTPIFHFPAITFWQAVGLLILSRLLFGGIPRGRRAKFVRGWGDLTPEEHDRFRRAMETCYPEVAHEHDAAAKKPESTS